MTIWLCVIITGFCIEATGTGDFPDKQACERAAAAAVREVAETFGPVRYLIECKEIGQAT